MVWYPHVTVATVIEQDGNFLMVEEQSEGKSVLNQPAGHLEANETLYEAALRETLEETRWQVELTGVLGHTLFTSPINNITYYRTTFVAKPIREHSERELDKDIDRALWLTEDEILENKHRLRSGLVLADIQRYRANICYPLNIIQQV